MGRRSQYDSVVAPYLEDIKKAVSSGATVKEIAKAFDLSVTTIYEYQKKYPEFAEAFARGRKHIVFDIKSALLKKALGYEYEEEKRVGRKDRNGENIVLIEKYKRHSPPSETAAAMLLRNYDETWSDKDKATVEIRKQETDLKKAIAEANYFDIEV